MQLAEGGYDVYISTPSAECRCAEIEQLSIGIKCPELDLI
jgi:hypothetical protein